MASHVTIDQATEKIAKTVAVALYYREAFEGQRVKILKIHSKMPKYWFSQKM